MTFSGLQCSSACTERKNSLDCLLNDDTVTVTLTEAVTAPAELTASEGTCAEGVTSTYTATGEAEGYAYTVTTTNTWEAGDHVFVNGKCIKCGEADPDSIAAPTIESVYSRVQTTAKVTWDAVDNAVGYQLWRSTDPNAADEDWTLTKTINSSNMDQYAKEDGTIQYTNVELEVGVTYYYKVRSFALQSGATDESDEASRIYSEFSDVAYMPAAVVMGDVYSAATNKVRLNWNEVGGADGYQIWRQNEDGSYSIVKTLGDKDNTLTDDQGATTAYSNVGLEAGKTYTYKMRAFSIPTDGTKVFGAYSDEITVAVMPESTTVSAESINANSVNISWESVSGAAGYQIWMSTSSDGEYQIAKGINDGSTIFYTKYELESGSTYYFKVRAFTDVDGKKTFGAYSNVVSVQVK